MADDWKPGDLALCVAGGPQRAKSTARYYPRAGAIYTVEAFGLFRFRGEEALALWFADAPANVDGQRVWGAARFRKIEDHVPDTEDEETIRLLKGVPVKEEML